MTALREVQPDTGEVYYSDLGKLAAALAKAQAAFPAITRSKTVKVQTKTGGSYEFAYAPLESIIEAVRKPLSDNGLAVAQLLDNGTLVTLLMHESGAVISGRTNIPQTADIQALGSAVTYLRRYAITALLGIATEQDDDGQTATASKSNKPAERPQRPVAVADAPTKPFTPLGGSEVPEDGQPEPPKPAPKAGMVQCESRSPYNYAPGMEIPQCRREQGHAGAHRTTNESWQ